MNIEGLRQKLLAVARAEKPADHVPYAFEKRILARIAGRPVADHWAQWAGPLWRAAASCVAVVLMMSAVSFYSAEHQHGQLAVNDLSQDFDQTLFAVVEQSGEVQ